MPSFKLLIIVIAVFLVGIFPGIAQAKTNGGSIEKKINKICEQKDLTKIFATPDQIVITPEALFIYTPSRDKLLNAEFIGLEEGKIFVAVSHSELMAKRGPCGLYAEWHKRSQGGCGGCGILLCPMNRTCFD